MKNDEREKLEAEWKEINERISSTELADPKDVRRKEVYNIIAYD